MEAHDDWHRTRTAFLRSSVLLSPLLFSSFPLALLLYSGWLGEEEEAERASEYKPPACFPQAPARKLVSEIRHFFPPLHSSLERTRAPSFAPTSTYAHVYLLYTASAVSRPPSVTLSLSLSLSPCARQKRTKRESGPLPLDKRSTTKNRATIGQIKSTLLFSPSFLLLFFLLVLFFSSSSFFFFFSSSSPFHVRLFW